MFIITINIFIVKTKTLLVSAILLRIYILLHGFSRSIIYSKSKVSKPYDFRDKDSLRAILVESKSVFEIVGLQEIRTFLLKTLIIFVNVYIFLAIETDI